MNHLLSESIDEELEDRNRNIFTLSNGSLQIFEPYKSDQEFLVNMPPTYEDCIKNTNNIIKF